MAKAHNKGRKRHSGKKQKKPVQKKPVRESWVDQLRFVPIQPEEWSEEDDDNHESNPQQIPVESKESQNDLANTTTDSSENDESFDPTRISIVSWNVLAEAYCSPRSHQRLPDRYQEVVFHKIRRKKRIIQVLQQLVETGATILCLQEVDLPEIRQELEARGFRALETPRVTNGGASGGRTDSCGIYVHQKVFEVVDHQLLRLDDLATYDTTSITAVDRNTPRSQQQDQEDNSSSPTPSDTHTKPPTIHSNWQGLQQSFLRRNAAIFVRVRHLATGRTLVIANAHLFWNPGYEFVKLCQAHFILVQAQKFVKQDEPLLFAGDFNSRPHGCTHTYLTQGFINAKRVAPWYGYTHFNTDAETDYKTQFGKSSKTTNSFEVFEDKQSDEDNHVETSDENKGNASIALANQLSSMTLNDDKRELGSVRYIMDATLNKICRWFRIMGIDTALETEAEEQMRTKENKFVIFDRCREEQRTMITTSTKLMHRRECPAGSYCINPVYLPSLELAMCHILLTHGVELDPEKFLTRCVVCNGRIMEVFGNEKKEAILRKYEAPTDNVHQMEVYECDHCSQGYWWDDRPNSSASRVKSAAVNLLTQCVRAGVPIKKDSNLQIFENLIDIEVERERGWDFSIKGSELLTQHLDVIDWLKNEHLECPFDLQSAYAVGWNDDDETVPFTNVTFSFVSTLDYIFYEPSKLELESRLYVPKSFAELNDLEIPQGHLLPSDCWPSDHLAIGANFSFAETAPAEKDTGVSVVDSASDGLPAAESTVLSSKNIESVDSMWCAPIGSSASSPPAISELQDSSSPQRENEESNKLWCAPLGSGAPPPPPIPTNTNSTSTKDHGQRCDCGCVPAIPSLFEMAKIRAQRKKEREEAQRND